MKELLIKNIGILQTPEGSFPHKGELQGETLKIRNAAVVAVDGIIQNIYSEGELPENADDTKRKEFAVRLIGRLIFCWFLKKKQSENKVQLIPDDVLSVSAVEIAAKQGGYYHTVLEPLFFEECQATVKIFAACFQ